MLSVFGAELRNLHWTLIGGTLARYDVRRHHTAATTVENRRIKIKSPICFIEYTDIKFIQLGSLTVVLVVVPVASLTVVPVARPMVRQVVLMS